jgi:hypothetical protein
MSARQILDARKKPMKKNKEKKEPMPNSQFFTRAWFFGMGNKVSSTLS